MKEAVYPGSHGNTYHSDEHQTAEERIQGREHLCARRFHSIDWTHAAEDHRGIKERVEPLESSSRMVADRTETYGT